MSEDFKLLFDREISLSIEQGFITASDLKGLSVEEIADIESKLNIELPSIYKYVLSILGNGGGKLLYANTILNYYHHNLLRGREDVLEMMEEDPSMSYDPIPANAFFFAEHTAIHYWYFICDLNPDPAVYYIFIGDSQPMKNCELSKFIIGTLKESIVHLQKNKK